MAKRILVMILAITVCMPVLSLGAYASDTNVSYDTAIGLIKAVYADYPEISDDGHTVSRGEFSQILTGIMGFTDFADTDSGFTDVSYDSSYASSISLLKKLGIISTGTLFYPDAPVQYAQAVKMAVAAAGYSVRAEAQGGYPTGYLTVANSLKLTRDVNSADGSLSIRDVTLLIYNLLRCDTMRQVSFGDTVEFSSAGDVSFMEYYHGIYETEGTVTANEYSGLTDSTDVTPANSIRIGNRIYYTANEAYRKLLGSRVTAYYTADGSSDRIVYMNEYDNSSVTLLPSDVTEVKDFVLYTYEDGKEEKYRLDRSYIYIKNGKHLAVTDDQNEYFDIDSGKITLTDNTGDGIYDVVNVSEYRYCFISSADPYKETISDQNTYESYLDLSDSECIYHIYDVHGDVYTPITLADLGKDTLIAYTESADRKLYNIYVCNNIVSGRFSDTDSENNIYIDGVPYRTNAYYKDHYCGLTLGSDADFRLAPDGSITLALSKSESALRYGWIVSTASKSAIDTRVQIKIFSQDGRMETPYLCSKVSFNGVSTDAKSVESAIKAMTDIEKTVKFSLNTEGEVNRIITSKDAPTYVLPGEANQSETDFVRYISGEDYALKYRSSTSIFTATDGETKTSFRISPSTYNFIIPKTDRNIEDNYSVYTPDSFVDGTEYAISAYDIDKSNHAGATICFDEVSDDVNSIGTLVIEKITQSFNLNGEPTLAVSGYSFGPRKYITCYASDKTRSAVEALSPGDLARVSLNEKNVITSVIQDFDLESYSLGSRVDSVGGSSEFMCGMIYNYTGGYMSIFTNTDTSTGVPVAPQPASRDMLLTFSVDANSPMFVDVKLSSDKSAVESVLVHPANTSEIKSYTEVGNNADFAVARRYQMGKCYTIIIYKIV